MKVVGAEIFLEYQHRTLGIRQERLALVPMILDTEMTDFICLKIRVKGNRGGDIEFLLDLGELRRIPNA